MCRIEQFALFYPYRFAYTVMSSSVSPTDTSSEAFAPKSVQWAKHNTPSEAATSASTYSDSRETTFATSMRTTQTDTEEEEEEEEEEDIVTADPSIATVDEDSPWARKYILSLDGGGVRGYSSLLLLKRLMDEVADLEKQYNAQASTSAFSPLIDSTSLFSDPMMKELENTYRPCHYFDYIGGSSTGGLIAIMLGRLRMTVDECLEAYQRLSATVFEKPANFLMRSLNKYSSSTRRDSFQELFETLRPNQPSPNEHGTKFKSDAVRCRTIVCSNRSDLSAKITAPYVFRSYQHPIRPPHEPFLYPRNPGDSSEFDIWEVARATSAAPSYFKSTTLYEYRYFDAAININNPSLEVYNEVSLLNKAHESVDLLLSLGTGNAKGNTTKAKHSLQSLQRELRDISDLVHHKIVDASKKASFSYYRWDVQGGLQDVRLDEWKPTSSGQNTRDRIERATVRYLSDPAVVEQIRECASTLVNARMLRAQTMRWESYATGTRYRCPIKGCQFPSLRFQNRNELMDHLQTVHGKAPPDAVNFQEIQTLLDQGRTNSE
ncbi:MAG: hypothetical protein LQ352_004938 [Teloschistes flavicans]|nr:MAG: hypothetical protein LQ352_004938 [Teloschistes flavicans]